VSSKLTDEGLPMIYDSEAIKNYWGSRPVDVTQRAGQIASSWVPYCFSLLIDQQLNRLQDKERLEAHAVELREMLTMLGPTFIKVSTDPARRGVVQNDTVSCLTRVLVPL
jgi:hypothetical protein